MEAFLVHTLYTSVVYSPLGDTFFYSLVSCFGCPVVQVRDLDESANRLMMTHPDQGENIYQHQKEINEMWNGLTTKVSHAVLTHLDGYV